MRLTDAQLDLQRAAGVPQQAPRRPQLHAQLHASRSAYDNGSGNGDNPADGCRGPRVLLGPERHRPSHIFVGTWTYRLPFFKDDEERPRLRARRLGSSRASRASSRAQPLTISGNTSIGSRRADYVGGDDRTSDAATCSPTTASCSGSTPPRSRRPPKAGAATATRGQVRGPDYQVVGHLAAQAVPVYRRRRRRSSRPTSSTRFNQVNWGNPATNLTGAGFGTISSVDRRRATSSSAPGSRSSRSARRGGASAPPRRFVRTLAVPRGPP